MALSSCSSGQEEQQEPVSRNVILMIGDGMGHNQLQAASYYLEGQQEYSTLQAFQVSMAMATELHGESYDSSNMWNSFTNPLLNPTDSAAAATAMGTGYRTTKGRLGMDPQGLVLQNLVEFYEVRGGATGLVTSVPISHATPAGFSIHHQDRNDYEEIARKMLEDSGLDILMGCGHPLYDNDGQLLSTAQSGAKYVGGLALWASLQQGLVGNDADGDGLDDPWILADQLNEIPTMSNQRVLYLPPVYQTLQQKRSDGAGFNSAVPSLVEMSLQALNHLEQQDSPFFLMIEGGAIDWAGHANQSDRLIEEMTDFLRALDAVHHWVSENSSWSETLLIFTADHETGYLWGPESGTGLEPDHRPLENPGQGNMPLMEWYSTGHSSMLVPLYIHGAGADDFHPSGFDLYYGNYLENTAIAQTIMANP